MAFKVGDMVRRINGNNSLSFQNNDIDIITEVKHNYFGGNPEQNGYITAKYYASINDERNLELVKRNVYATY